MASNSIFAKKTRSLILKKGLLTEPKADEALEIAIRDNKSYQEVLFEKGMLDELSFIAGVASEMGLPPIDVTKVEPEERAIQSLSQEWSTYYGVLPIARIGNILTLAVANPFDILKLDELRLLTGCDIRPVVSTERAIRKAVTRAYNPGAQEMKDVLESAEKTNAEIELKEGEEEEQVDLSQITNASGDSPIVKLVNMIISQGLKEGASDIHIEPYEKAVKVRYRRDGVLGEGVAPPKRMHNAIVSRIKIMCGMDIAERRRPQDGKFQIRYENRQIDFRVSILPTIHGEKCVMRILDSGSLAHDLGKLGFETQTLDAIRKAVNSPYGMILVTGPTGSGKSTTLYSCVSEVLSPEDNFVTVEDPVEYQMEGVVQVQVNEKQGLTFPGALRSILRQDPDVVMIGEIRDHETADIAVKAAITGHLVLSTLHTNDAASTVTRLVDMGVDPFMVGSSVVLVCAQRLLRKLCDSCKAPEADIPKERLLDVGFLPEELPNLKLFRAVGCARCKNGFKGRFAVIEALEIDDNIRKLVIKGNGALAIKEYAVKHGMLTLRRCALLNAGRGKTAVEEVLRMTMEDGKSEAPLET
ncbi:MAG: Flp pilus assembly complex ATPase component TadA [Planctomycetes bacterium]|nr:Flp pilus assembly complex ATPase component TadA [Planctomycetota bacterium]